MNRRTRSKVLRISCVVLLATAILPLPQIVAPAWTVTTLDSTHKPLRGLTVREVWQQYSIDTSSHEEDRLTDDNGQARFSRRTHWSTFIGRFAGCIRQLARTGIDASCGPNSNLVVFGHDTDTLDWQNPSQEDGTTLLWQHSILIRNH